MRLCLRTGDGKLVRTVGLCAVFLTAAGRPAAQAPTAGQPSLTSIAVDSGNPTIVVGQTSPFTASGTFSDGSTQALSAGGILPPSGLGSW